MADDDTTTPSSSSHTASVDNHGNNPAQLQEQEPADFESAFYRIKIHEGVTLAQSVDVLRSLLRTENGSEMPIRHGVTSDYPLIPSREGVYDDAAPAVPLAKSEEFLMRQLRSSSPSQEPKPSPPRPSITRPESPQFAPLHHRQLPKSTEEREEEMMEYFRQHPFAALPSPSEQHLEDTFDSIMDDDDDDEDHNHQRTTASLPRTLTHPEPFHFRSEERTRPVVHDITPTKEELDLQECQKQFRAMPLPGGMSVSGRIAAVSPSKKKQPQETEEEENPISSFHARPLPKSTYQPQRRPKPQQPQNIRPVVTPPKNTTTKPVPKDLKPFQLQSLQRHQQRKEQLAAQRRREQAQERERRLFRARPLPGTSNNNGATPSPVRKAPKKAQPYASQYDQVQPFQLASVQRHEQRKQQLDAERRCREEQERQQRQFRARPLPKHSASKPAVL